LTPGLLSTPDRVSRFAGFLAYRLRVEAATCPAT
jgi:hypothetical protein